MTSYFIKLPGQPSWTKVTKDSFVAVERHCGFNNTMGQPDEPGTGGFGSPFGEGRVQLSDDDVEPVDIDFEICTATMRIPNPDRTGYCLVGAANATLAVTRELDRLDREQARAIVKTVASVHQCLHLFGQHRSDHLCRCGTSWEDRSSW